jgi:tRNA(Leu) C34 or U34 (ribose-2'-O)-methylase TrmL
MTAGYWGVALYQPQTETNWGTVLRSAYNFNASFIMTIGRKYERQCSDTVNASKNLPYYHYESMRDFLNGMPEDCALIRVEVDGDKKLETFTHPKRAVYLFGPENGTVPKLAEEYSLSIETNRCLNLAVAASVVMYDRHAKERRV